MSVDAVSGRSFRDVAIPGLTDIANSQQPATSSSSSREFPNLTPAQSAANAAAAGATTAKTDSSDPLSKAAGSLDKNAFLKLLVQEMTNQDPLKPADNTQFIAQLAQFSTLEQMQNMNTGFTNLQTSFETAQARGLIGVPIKAVNSTTGAEVNGVVDEVVVGSGGSVQVDVNGTAVNIGDIVSIGPGSQTSSSTNSGASLPGTLVPPSGSPGGGQ